MEDCKIQVDVIDECELWVDRARFALLNGWTITLAPFLMASVTDLSFFKETDWESEMDNDQSESLAMMKIDAQ